MLYGKIFEASDQHCGTHKTKSVKSISKKKMEKEERKGEEEVKGREGEGGGKKKRRKRRRWKGKEEEGREREEEEERWMERREKEQEHATPMKQWGVEETTDNYSDIWTKATAFTELPCFGLEIKRSKLSLVHFSSFLKELSVIKGTGEWRWNVKMIFSKLKLGILWISWKQIQPHDIKRDPREHLLISSAMSPAPTSPRKT